jgi:hypothetical protein
VGPEQARGDACRDREQHHPDLRAAVAPAPPLGGTAIHDR